MMNLSQRLRNSVPFVPHLSGAWGPALFTLILAVGCGTGVSDGTTSDEDEDRASGVGGNENGEGGAFSSSGGAGGDENLGTGGVIPIHPSCPGVSTDAYLGMPSSIPGIVEAENFDTAGFSDTTAGNEDGAYRTDTDVDIKELGEGHAISWWNEGEWLEYTISVPTSGEYEVTFTGGSVGAGQTFSLSSCGSALATDVSAPQIAEWGQTAEVSFDLQLSAGVQVIRVTVGSGYVDFDSLEFELVSENVGSGGSAGTGGSGTTCALPSTYAWTSSGPLAQPAEDSWHALKDFSVTKYNGKYLVYGTVANGGWNGFFSVFDDWSDWATAPQNYHGGHVAPTIFYFAPKDVWVLAYQWGFQYKTTKTPDVWDSWSSGKSLMSYNPDPTEDRGTGPIDQTVICDDEDCYLFFNDDAGSVYRASMPIDDFPGEFTNAARIMEQYPDTSVIFEGVQVYSVKGSDKYLMIIENNGTRAFRAWTATDLGGSWTPLAGANTTQSPFAGQANTTWTGEKWTNDISHGDIVRENPSEKMEIDPCNLQLLYQGRNPEVNVGYGELPYRPGVLTLVR